MEVKLAKLSYAYNALEPYIDGKTMEIHHSKHHQGYVDKVNAILEKYEEFKGKSLEEIMASIDSFKLEGADRQGLVNNGGGVLNHNLFFSVMGPKKEVSRELVTDIEKKWASVDKFKEEFGEAAMSRFGSGWAWLARNDRGNLEIYSSANQDSPLLKGYTPIFGLDVWEHAYYLKYQNRRAEYIENWWNVLKLI